MNTKELAYTTKRNIGLAVSFVTMLASTIYLVIYIFLYNGFITEATDDHCVYELNGTEYDVYFWFAAILLLGILNYTVRCVTLLVAFVQWVAWHLNCLNCLLQTSMAFLDFAFILSMIIIRYTGGGAECTQIGAQYHETGIHMQTMIILHILLNPILYAISCGGIAWKLYDKDKANSANHPIRS